MATREITPGTAKITLEGIPGFTNGNVSVMHRPATAQDALDIVNELGGAAEFEVVDSKAGWIRLKSSDVSIEIMGPRTEDSATSVVSAWEADPTKENSGATVE